MFVCWCRAERRFLELYNMCNSKTATLILFLFAAALQAQVGGSIANPAAGVWNGLGAPTASLGPLAMGANTSIFTTTTAEAQMFAWKNTTAAVVGTSQG